VAIRRPRTDRQVIAEMNVEVGAVCGRESYDMVFCRPRRLGKGSNSL
jgi:hypothetical protein